MYDHLSDPLLADPPQSAGHGGGGPLIDDALVTVLREGYGPVAEQLVVLFEDGTAPLIAELRVAQATDDGESLRRAGHRLKGSCQSIGASFMASIATDFEQGRASATDVDRLQAALAPTARALRLALMPLA